MKSNTPQQRQENQERQRARMAADRFAADIGIDLLEAGIGHAKAQLTIKPRHLNGVDVVQGGVLFTLADFAFAAACNYDEEKVISIETQISFIKSVHEGTIRAEAHEVSRTKRLRSCDVRVTNDNGDLLASLHVRGYAIK